MKSVEVGILPSDPAGIPGDPLQPMRERPLRGRLPDRGHVPPPGRDRRLRQVGSASAAKPVWRPAPTTPSSSTPRTTPRRNATFCAHRLEVGLEPACVTVCPTEAILVGDLHDPTSRVAAIVGRRAGGGTPPGEGNPPEAVLPGRRPGHPGSPGGSAARRRAVRLVDPGRPGPAPAWWHRAIPADRRRAPPPCCPTTSPSGAVGVAGEPLHLDQGYRGRRHAGDGHPRDRRAALLGRRPHRLVGPVLAGAFLALTGLLLIWDLKQPRRFYLLLTRPQWRSWLVRGA